MFIVGKKKLEYQREIFKELYYGWCILKNNNFKLFF